MTNFLSKALMPLLVDKKARERMARKDAVRSKLETLGIDPNDPNQVRKLFKRKESAKTAQPQQPAPKKNPELGFDVRDREAVLAALRANKERMDAIERRKLIKNAQELRRAKTHVLSDLDDEQRAKLHQLAKKALLGKSQ